VVTPIKRMLILLAPVVLAFSLATPAHAAPRPAPAVLNGFAESVKRAFAVAAPGYRLRHATSQTAGSELDPAQGSRGDMVAFSLGKKVLGVTREVGAFRDAVATARTEGTLVSAVSLHRPGAGTRPAVVTSTATAGSSGLTVLSWSERPGVNYEVVSRDALGGAGLVKIAQALPADRSTVSSTARALIAKAKPPVYPNIDQQTPKPGGPGFKPGGLVQLSATNYYVDGAGVTTDDLDNEATLCAGCAWSNGNYAGMWQIILYADGYLNWSLIDCSFGAQTAASTKSWQWAKGLTSDGIVGPHSRATASSQLRGNIYVSYWGSYDMPTFTRDPNNYRYSYQNVELSYDFRAGRIPIC
jgi:peptidoglycan hydrolase-like protein with peptidoglycan-binding domain